MHNLDKIIKLRKCLIDESQHETGVSGVLLFDQSILPLLEEIANSSIEIKKDGKAVVLSRLTEGDKLETIISGHIDNFYEKFDLFIQHFPDKEPAHRYYIHELEFDSEYSQNTPREIVLYKSVISFWKLLGDLADHKDKRRLFLLSSDKLEIECSYQVSDLRELPKLEALIADFSPSAASREEKKTLFKRALFEALRKVETQKRFSNLLAHFEAVYDRYWQNFRLFLEGISYESIFESYVTKHSKLITEINSVLGGIQTAIIGLPIASFVLLEKMEVANEHTFKNILLLLGCIVFVAFLFVLSFSQGRTLESTKELAEELNEEVKKKHPELAEKLKKSMGRLKCHQSRITKLLWIIRGLLTLLAVASIGTYLYVSCSGIRDFSNDFLKNLTTQTDTRQHEQVKTPHS